MATEKKRGMAHWTDQQFAQLVANGIPISASLKAHPEENEAIASRCRRIEERARITAQRHEAMAAHQRALMATGGGPDSWHT